MYLYVYLESPVSNSTINKQMASHAATKQTVPYKKVQFIFRKNIDAPFAVKKVVWDSVLSF